MYYLHRLVLNISNNYNFNLKNIFRSDPDIYLNAKNMNYNEKNVIQGNS